MRLGLCSKLLRFTRVPNLGALFRIIHIKVERFPRGTILSGTHFVLLLLHTCRRVCIAEHLRSGASVTRPQSVLPEWDTSKSIHILV